MGQLTEQVFNESCCDGGSTTIGTKSCQPCGCDEGANHLCQRHMKERLLGEIKEKFGVIEEKRKEIETGMAEHREVRKFETGATRDLDTDKLDFEGFESPLVIERFAEFMNTNRKQKDGSLRDSDNWQKGIPKQAYMKSMWRHLMDVWLHHRGWGSKAKEPLEVALCALRFNVSGYLFEVLKEKSSS